MKFISIGFGNYASPARIIAAVDPDSNPIKRIVSQAKNSGRLIDATFGRKTKSVLVMDSDHVILSPLDPDEIARRISGEEGSGEDEA